MKTRKHLILEELGLTPVWRLRNGAPVAEEPPVDAPAIEPSSAPREMSQPAPVTHHSSPIAGGDDRRAAIMRMEWPALKESVASCVACPLHAKRNKTVFGVGDENADWLFVGEGPGAEEDAQGEPFVGQAGRLLDSMLASIKLKRGANVYIANVVKCRPPGNRNPEPAEAHSCEPYLHRQIDLIRPKLIVALGKVAAANLLASDASVASMRGKVHQYRGIPLVVMYHPAYLLRTLNDKAKAWTDLCFAVETMQGLQGGRVAPI
ncbi:MAG: uracil-DNA glycosylase [Bradyrhizobium sp.]